jgi:hypothetical protein
MATKRTNKASARILHRVNEAMAGTDLWTYTGAVFIVLNLTQPKSKGVRPVNMTCFYNSGSIMRHHTANGNFKKENGMVKLTSKGRAHFKIRYSEDSAQFVDRSEAAQLAKALISGNVSDLPAEWKGNVTLSPVTLK